MCIRNYTGIRPLLPHARDYLVQIRFVAEIGFAVIEERALDF